MEPRTTCRARPTKSMPGTLAAMAWGVVCIAACELSQLSYVSPAAIRSLGWVESDLLAAEGLAPALTNRTGSDGQPASTSSDASVDLLATPVLTGLPDASSLRMPA